MGSARQSGTRAATAALVAVAALLLPAPAAAWTPATQAEIARRAASIVPPDLRRQIERHERDFKDGAADAFRDADAARHVKNEDGGGALDATIREEAALAIRAIQGHQPFSEIVYRLGRVSHYVADANNPLNTSRADPDEARYAADFLRYAESAQERFAVIFYPEGRELRTPADLDALVAASLARGRKLYASVGAEYRRIGEIRGRERFDDRSAAFGAASLAFSHAVSDDAAVLRYIWLAAGGADGRPLGLSPPRAAAREAAAGHP